MLSPPWGIILDNKQLHYKPKHNNRCLKLVFLLWLKINLCQILWDNAQKNACIPTETWNIKIIIICKDRQRDKHYPARRNEMWEQTSGAALGEQFTISAVNSSRSSLVVWWKLDFKPHGWKVSGLQFPWTLQQMNTASKDKVVRYVRITGWCSKMKGRFALRTACFLENRDEAISSVVTAITTDVRHRSQSTAPSC